MLSKYVLVMLICNAGQCVEYSPAEQPVFDNRQDCERKKQTLLRDAKSGTMRVFCKPQRMDEVREGE